MGNGAAIYIQNPITLRPLSHLVGINSASKRWEQGEDQTWI